jgi:endonuclease/exonuclease/phosphatase family metal-dependent hydrolase
MAYRILFSNIGYAKGIDGSLRQHIARFARHFYSRMSVQEQVLKELNAIIALEHPDLCCFVEIDSGSAQSSRCNQIQALLNETYAHHDIADKYGPNNNISRMPLHGGRSNGFLSRHDLVFEKLYFKNGTKRLIYKIALPRGIPGNIHVFFTHFSLQKKIRARQFEEVRKIILDTPGETILLADFNIFYGFKELTPLLQTEDLVVLNNEKDPTFRFSNKRLALDLCLCSKSLLPRLALRIVPQPFSDHAALLVEII